MTMLAVEKTFDWERTMEQEGAIMNRYHEIIRPVWAEIDLAAIRHNLGEIRRMVGPSVEIMAVIKAEAYGHGAVPVAKTAIRHGAGSLGVFLPEEGIALRKAGISVPILVFEPLQENQAESFARYDLTATVCIAEAVSALSQAAVRQGKVTNVHIKTDTGMGRVGLQPGVVSDFIGQITSLPGIKVSGIFSHLATADETNKDYARRQISVFSELLQQLKSAGRAPEKNHLANSAGIIDLPEAHFNMVRPGIMLYGLYPSAEVNHSKVNLAPALSLKARVTYVKRVPEGSGISYGQKYHTRRETTIATIPIGYADGWSRILSNRAQVLINGKKFPVVGTICMDQCMVDVGDEPVSLGQEAVLIGAQGQEAITAEMVAAQLGTINYEVTCMLSDRVPRVYKNDDELSVE
ncbi:MAG TPA: alanine racemase [Bacillota bacterium]|nr:alanine racemase [Bacillota bacterium]